MPTACHFALFDTPLGVGGIAWTARGVCGTELPQPESARMRARLHRRFPSAAESNPPSDIRQAIELMTRVLAGERAELSSVALDMHSVPLFERQVYTIARSIGFGETTSYGQIARRLGDVSLARDVGQALAHNPFPVVVPCHRVVAANGKLGGFSARGGVATKQRLLSIERANVSWQLPLEA